MTVSLGGVGANQLEVSGIPLEAFERPTTIPDATFRVKRVETMRIKLSAAYKGANAILMK